MMFPSARIGAATGAKFVAQRQNLLVTRHNRLFFGTATSTTSNHSNYISPFADFFDSIDRNAGCSVTDALSDLNVNNFGYGPLPKKRVLKCGIPEDALRFSSTSYGRTLQAPTVHPNEHRVVLKINTNELPFNRNGNAASCIEMELLRQVVGNRLNDERKELRLTSNQFGSRIENKRHLVSMLDRIVLSCQRLARELVKEENEVKARMDTDQEVGVTSTSKDQLETA